jgi:hypothetical protein
MAGAGAASLPALHVHEVYERVRGAIGDEHSAEIDPDQHAAFVTAVVLHFQHGLPIASAFQAVRVLVGSGGFWSKWSTSGHCAPPRLGR